MIVLCLMTALGGFAGLFLGMGRHQRDVLGRVLSSSMSFRCKLVGWLALAFSFLLAVLRDGTALGAVYWLGESTLAALCVALCSTWLSSRRKPRVGADPVREPSTLPVNE